MGRSLVTGWLGPLLLCAGLGCTTFIDQMEDDDDLPPVDDDTADDDATADDDTEGDDDVADDDTADDDSTPPPGPVAVCSADPPVVQPPFTAATYVGHDSYDPAGHAIVHYSWGLTAIPPGSAATLICGDEPDCGPIQPDLAGTYAAHLVVENDIGETDSCTVGLEAIPLESLWIEMFWTHDDDDMDLHLLAPGGQLVTDTDCYYGNCVGIWNQLDWGQPGYDGDDPSLDLDDIPGTGPENINIADPQPGTFTVVVNDYTGSTGDSPPTNPVTVNVYLDGLPAWSDTRELGAEGTYLPFCEVDWPSGVVTPL